eukprot:TRINITY_DN2550_c0_g1_i3.p1 TRINITY_DN2550_c0_g1~~TRINITY_DN2550_c0_g1_i3.p1  ORF type:complete len:826 (+),score=257.23 TRINITY_DN2550_c0_g1_i3:74-2551(+)
MHKAVGIVLLALGFWTACVQARSDGVLGYCNIYTKIGKGSAVMPWVQAPVYAPQWYTLRSGDGDPSTDPKSYVPGKMMTIHLRVLDLDLKYIGLLMYAVNTRGDKVGNWSITPGTAFQIHPFCQPDSVITHTDADLKPLYTRFFLRVPAGTGPISIITLIKQGEQNKGNFYMTPPLNLTEAVPPPPPTTQVVLADDGTSCRSTCSSQPQAIYCDNTATSLMNSPYYLDQGATLASVPCRMPMVSGCSAQAPLRDPNGFCYFKSPTCATDRRPTTNTSCTARLTGVQRFCVCSTMNTDSNPFTPPPAPSPGGGGSGGAPGTGTGGAGPTSAGVTVTGSVWSVLAMMATLVAFQSGSKSVLLSMLVVMTAMLQPTLAHNWVGSPSRALVASVANPCQARVDNQPHVQVAAGQEFQMEWSVGHGDSSTKWYYFVAIHSKDYDQLKFLTQAMIDDYINSAPPSAMLNGTKWQKRHMFDRADQASYINGYFQNEAPVDPSNPNYIPRESIYAAKSMLGTPSDQYMFNPSLTAMDRRVAYASDKYPFIEAAHRFQNSFNEHIPFSHQYDFAMFSIPARQGPGDYIYWFKWGGYKDCVDVNIYPTTVARPYGTVNSTGSGDFVKLDNCEYLFVLNPKTQCTIMANNSADVCLKACAANRGCTGVQAVRAFNLPWTLPYPENIPYLSWNSSQVEPVNKPNGPCGYFSVPRRTRAGCNVINSNCNPAVLKPGPNDYICYGLVPFRDQDLQAGEDYETTKDPRDPKFYSTCWIKTTPQGFLDVPPMRKITPPWNYAERCVSCKFRQYVANVSTSIAPDWALGLTDQCVQCDSDQL